MIVTAGSAAVRSEYATTNAQSALPLRHSMQALLRRNALYRKDGTCNGSECLLAKQADFRRCLFFFFKVEFPILCIAHGSKELIGLM